MSVPSDIAAARAAVLDRIAKAAGASGRAPESITLTAVSKLQPDDRVEAMLATGQRIFGENRVREAEARWTERRAKFADLSLRLIGPLQTNKVADAVAFFDVIESLDRPKLAAALADAAQKQGRSPENLIQVNTGEEEQKAGIAPSRPTPIKPPRNLRLGVRGPYVHPPVDEERVHALLARSLPATASHPSMGMSDDFENRHPFRRHPRPGRFSYSAPELT
jgi:hypothetical protein